MVILVKLRLFTSMTYGLVLCRSIFFETPQATPEGLYRTFHCPVRYYLNSNRSNCNLSIGLIYSSPKSVVTFSSPLSRSGGGVGGEGLPQLS